MVYLQVENLTKSFGNRLLFSNISFGIESGQKMAVVAQNGAGKTTLLRILNNRESCDAGTVTYHRDIRVALLDQNPHFRERATVAEACFEQDNDVVHAIARYENLINHHADDARYHAEIQNAMSDMDRLNAWDYDTKIKQILGKLDIHDLSQQVSTMSGGQQKRLALAATLIAEPDLLMLDEPTNHLDLEMVEWLEDYLSRSKMALLMVTHDRYFLDHVCSDILEIDNHTLYHYHGNYSYYLERREERIANFNAETERYKNIYRTELDWMRRQPQARAHKAQSRIDAFYEIETRARARIQERQVVLGVKAGYTGSKIFEAKYINKAYGDNVLFDNFYYNFSRYEKLGIIGKNGTGKSTFLKMLVGTEKTDSGSFDIGQTVRFAYYSQSGLDFNPGMKVIDAVRKVAEEVDLGGGRKLSASQFLSQFLFPPAKQHDYIEKLSGGELRRLYLCTVLMQSPNFLVLDEPTNDLDIATLNVLEEYLVNFKGCVIVVSHDRFFMDKVVDHLLVFHGQARIQDFPGNYTDYRCYRELKQQEKQSQTAQEKKTERNTKPARTEQSRRLTYKEQREYESLETEIEALEAEKAQIEAALSLGQLSNEQIAAHSARYQEIVDLCDEKTMRWLELDEIASKK